MKFKQSVNKEYKPGTVFFEAGNEENAEIGIILKKYKITGYIGNAHNGILYSIVKYDNNFDASFYDEWYILRSTKIIYDPDDETT